VNQDSVVTNKIGKNGSKNVNYFDKKIAKKFNFSRREVPR
jgi:hypothetical protein